MAYVTLNTGLRFPYAFPVPTAATIGTMDATTEKVALFGYCYIDGRPGSSKTISAAGGGSISFRTGTTVFADGGSTVEIGIQDMSTSGPAQPDGTFDVSRVLTGNAVSPITTAAFNTIAMTGGSGSKSISHGQLIAIVFDMTARAGSDSVIIQGTTGVGLNNLTTGQMGLPGANVFVGSWGTTGTALGPFAIITFDDGTLGYLDGTVPAIRSDTAAFSDSSNPDEYCEIFQVPFDCKVDALYASLLQPSSATTSDFTITLYSDPTGTPASMGSTVVLAEQFLNAAFFNPGIVATLAAEVDLAADTDYAVAIRANGAGTLQVNGYVLANATHRALLLGGTLLVSGSRQNGAGAFGSTSTTQHYVVGARISSISTGGAGGIAHIIGG
jgi:hypothetical protein